jgi:hypothetical protein
VIIVCGMTCAIFSWRNYLTQGYSHGSLIASLQPILPPPIKTSYILISYPLSTRGLLTLFHTRKYATALSGLIHSRAVDVLIIYGDKDEFTGAPEYDTWSEELKKDAAGDGTVRLYVVKIGGGSHFWRGREGKEMTNAIRQWLS